MSNNNDVVHATQTTSSSTGPAPSAAGPAPSSLGTSGANRHHLPTTLLTCPSIINIIAQQHEPTNTINSNNCSCNDGKQNLTTSTSSATTTKTTTTAAAETMANNGNKQQETTISASLSRSSTTTAIEATTALTVVATAAPTTDITSSLVHIPNHLQLHHKPTELQQLLLEQQFTQIPYSDDDDSAMKSLERNDSVSSGFCTRSGSGTLELELSAMVAAIYEQEIAK